MCSLNCVIANIEAKKINVKQTLSGKQQLKRVRTMVLYTDVINKEKHRF